MISPRVDQFDGFPFSLCTGFLGEHTDIAEGNVAVTGSARSVALHRLVRERLDAQGSHLGQRHFGRDDPAIVIGVLAGKEEGAVALGGKGCPVERLGFGGVQSRPNRGTGRFDVGVVQPVVEALW